MKPIYILIFTLVLFSCGKEKSVLLPEIENAKVTEVLDVSPAYLFYNEALPDSIELNRKNLIGTTNWLFNVDKRLTLEQAIPKIKFLQDKKRNAQMHKNENAKNYYTCNDTSIKNLGFVEFTDVIYHNGHSSDKNVKTSQIFLDRTIKLPEINIEKKVHFIGFNENDEPEYKKLEYSDFMNYLKLVKMNNTKDSLIIKLNFDKNLSFQDYIGFKSIIEGIHIEGIHIDNTEFIY